MTVKEGALLSSLGLAFRGGIKPLQSWKLPPSHLEERPQSQKLQSSHLLLPPNTLLYWGAPTFHLLDLALAVPPVWYTLTSI